MEIIRKKICFESARSRQQGLLAFIGYDYLPSSDRVNTVCYEEVCKTDLRSGEVTFETVEVANNNIDSNKFIYVTTSHKDGNFGNFVCNPYISGGTGEELFGVGYVNYMDIISRYNKIHSLLFNGLKLKRIVIHNDVYYIDEFDDNVNLYDYNIVNGSNLVEKRNGRYQADDESIVYETTKEVDNCGIERIVKKATKKKIAVNYGPFINSIKDYDYLVSLCEFFGGIKNIFKFCNFVESNFIGILPIPAEITGDSVPEFLYYSDIVEWYEWFKTHEDDTNCCIKETWEKKGGNSMYAFLRENLDTYTDALENAKKFFVEDDEFGRHIPKINVCVQLTSKMDDVGIVTNYIDPDTDYSFNGLTYKTPDDDYPPFERVIDDIRINSGTANSKLHLLKTPYPSHDDSGEELPGILSEKILYYSYNDNHKRWDKTDPKLDSSYLVINTARLTIPPSFLSTPSAGLDSYTIDPSLGLEFCGEDRILTTHLPFLDIPFKTASEPNGYVLNMEYVRYYDDDIEYINVKEIENDEFNSKSICCEMVGDYITNIDRDADNGTKIKFEYTIQGHFWAQVVSNNDDNGQTNQSYRLKFVKEIEGTGIKYIEEYNYWKREIGPFLFNDISEKDRDCSNLNQHIEVGGLVERMINGYYIDFDSAMVKIQHQELGLERDGLLTTIADYAAGDVWREGLFCISAIPFENKSILKDCYKENISSLDNEKINCLVKTLNGHNRESIKTPIYKEETLNGIKADINVKVNISVNRGLAAAREMHYKLSECNSLEDMENYGNNYFNIQINK